MADREDDPPELHAARRGRTARVGELEAAYVSALLAADEIAAEIAIREAMEAGLGAAEISELIVAPALWQVGELWQRGEISVADEHVATEISIRVLALQHEAQRVARARGRHRVLLAAPAGERHVVALRMVGNLLSAAGYSIVMLGADVPADALVACVRRYEPDVICLTLTMPLLAGQMLNSIVHVQAARPATRFVVGGRGLSVQLRSRPGVEFCARVSDAVESVDASVKRAALN